jgi:OFA family oxalate/formate antiporter-like MFS transporter
VISIKKIYWGWYVVWGAFILMAINYGARYCFGIFIKPMSAEYQWSRSVISFAASLMIVTYGVGGILTGRILDRMAPRHMMTFGAAIVGLGLVLTAFIRTPWQFYLTYGLLCGLGSSCFGVVVCNSSVGKWFVKKRGLTIGIASIGIGFGTMVLAPLAGYIVKVYGWRSGFIFLGVMVFIVGISASQLFMGRTNPEDYDLKPDGEVSLDNGISDAEVAQVHPVPGSLRTVIKDSRFWILALCYSFAVVAEMSAFMHQVAYAIDNHIEKVTAASSVGVVGVASILGRFFFGWLSDRISDAKYAASLGFAFMALGMVILLWVDSPVMLLIYSILFGFGYGSMAPMMPYLLAHLFGRHVLGASYGFLTFFVGIGGGIGPLLAGQIYDRFGSYAYAWRINIAILVVVTFAILWLKPRSAGQAAD